MDKKPSARRPDLFFSYKACNGKIEDDADNDIFRDEDNDQPVAKPAEDSNCECSDILLHDSKSGNNNSINILQLIATLGPVSYTHLTLPTNREV